MSALEGLPAAVGRAPLEPQTLAGRRLVVNFWATWCEPCRDEMPGLQRLSDSADDILVIGVSLDGDVNLAREFLLRHGIRFPNYSMPVDEGRRRGLAIPALPETWLVGTEGRVRARISGARDWSSVEERKHLRALLDERSA